MKRWNPRMAGGFLIVGFGILWLLQEIGGFESIFGILAGLLIAASGLVFLVLFERNRAHWWAALAGFVLLGLGVLIILQRYAPAFATTYGGSLYLGGVSLAFLLAYLANRDRWWAVILAGLVFTLAVVPLLESLLSPAIMVGLLLFGFAATFLVVFLLPSQDGRRRWALIPTGILAMSGVTTLVLMHPSLRHLWPLGLILAGVVALVLVVLPKRAKGGR
jgi:hypothetical protein